MTAARRVASRPARARAGLPFGRPGAELFVPDGQALPRALARTTHLGVVAHADDLELLALGGILECFGSRERWFSGVVLTDGAGAPRSGPYAGYSDARLRALRRREQRKAAVLGEYGAVALLDYTSTMVKRAARGVVADLVTLLRAARPDVVYTHDLADRHDTHVACTLAVVAACRALPPAARPRRLLGGEVWRSLDWLADVDRVCEDVSGHEALAAALIGAFHSQTAGGKRNDLAVLGRRRAHATYQASHRPDAATALSLAMDLTPLIAEPARSPQQHVDVLIGRFATEVRARLARVAPGAR